MGWLLFSLVALRSRSALSRNNPAQPRSILWIDCVHMVETRTLEPISRRCHGHRDSF
jgi:hypothetical protein